MKPSKYLRCYWCFEQFWRYISLLLNALPIYNLSTKQEPSFHIYFRHVDTPRLWVACFFYENSWALLVQFVKAVYFNSGLCTFLHYLIRRISDDWQLLWANSTHTATTAPFLRKPTSNNQSFENRHISSTVEDNPYKLYFYELCKPLSISLDTKPKL